MSKKQRNPPKNPTKANTQKTNVLAEIAHIRKETRRLETLMQSLPEQRVTLLRQLNELQSSIRTFPSEVLLRVFQHSISSTADSELPDGGASYLPITLGSVSFRWRQVVHSAPQLWSTLRVDPRPKTLRSIVAILQLYFTNSRHVPFSLSVGMCRPDLLENGEPELFRRFFTEIFVHNAGRIRSLHVVNPSAQWVERVSNAFGNLEHLWLECQSSSTNVVRRLKLTAPPSLLRITLRGIGAHITKLSSNTITSITLEGVPILTCMALLEQCRHLTEYYCRSPIELSAAVTIPNGHPLKKGFPLSNLEVLEWTCFPHHCSTDAIGRISLPALETLFWHTGYIQKDDVILPFFSRLPPTLSRLVIYTASLHKAAVRHIFTSDSMQGLRTVEIVDCSVNFIHDFLLLLTPSWRDNMGIEYIPLLEWLILENTEQTGDPYDKDSALYVVDMVERRKLVGHNRDFNLHLINLPIDWNPIIQEKFQELVSDGLELVIKENSEPVDWLS